VFKLEHALLVVMRMEAKKNRKETEMIRLKTVDGRLELPPSDRIPEGAFLMTLSEYGELETFSTRKLDKPGLARALFDEREMGNIPVDTKKVELPNGEEFEISAHIK